MLAQMSRRNCIAPLIRSQPPSTLQWRTSPRSFPASGALLSVGCWREDRRTTTIRFLAPPSLHLGGGFCCRLAQSRPKFTIEITNRKNFLPKSLPSLSVGIDMDNRRYIGPRRSNSSKQSIQPARPRRPAWRWIGTCLITGMEDMGISRIIIR